MSEALVLPLTTIGIIIIIALTFSILVRKIGQNEVIGFIIAGFLLGPFFLNFLAPTDPLIVGFGELGLFILLFYLGIELSLKEFLGAGSTIFGLAMIDMTLTAGFGIVVLLALGFDFLFAAIVGIMLFCTSTAIVGKFIIDNKLLENASATFAHAILILQDFFGTLLLVFITALSTPAAVSPGSLALIAVAFAVSAFYAVFHLSKMVENWLYKNGFGHTEMTLYALGIGLVVATLATVVGLSTAIGAYFAGFALSETRASHQIKKDVGFLRDFFLVFFFVGFGTTLFYDTTAHALALPSPDQAVFLVGIAVLLVAVAIIAHSLVTRIFGALFGLSAEDASLSAILLSPLGEFVVILATVAISASILSGPQAKLLSPLAFLLIIITLLLFQPMYHARELHKKIFGLFPRFPEHRKKTKLVPHTSVTIAKVKEIALNVFVILCFAWVTVLLYADLPRFGVPILYSREVTAAILFLFFASFPFYRMSRAFLRIYTHIRANAR